MCRKSGETGVASTGDWCHSGQLLGNNTTHTTIALRKAMLIQINSWLRDLVRDEDFKDVTSVLFGEGFGALVK